MVFTQNLIFRFLQSRQKVQIWLYEQTDLRIEGRIIVSTSKCFINSGLSLFACIWVHKLEKHSYHDQLENNGLWYARVLMST